MNVLFLFGSATGNSESISKRLQSEAIEKGYQATVETLNQYANDKLLNFDVIVIVCATTGNGDPPENSEVFFRWVKKPQTILKGKYYAVLGLGDTNYENFCKMGVSIDKRMTELGAMPVLKRGTADDATGLEKVIEPWIDSLWVNLAEKKDMIVSSRVSLNVPMTTTSTIPVTVEPNIEKVFTKCKIVNVEMLMDSSAQKQVVHVELDTAGLKYEVGQVITILPTIPMNRLEELSKSYSSQELMVLETLDLCAPLKSHQLESLGFKGESPASLLDLIKKTKKFPSYAEIVKSVTKIYPRNYSISSSPVVNSKLLSFAYTVHDFKVGNEIHMGLGTSFLDRHVQIFLKGQDSHLPVQLTSSSTPFEIPTNDTDPIVFIAPGTGISPFVGILSHLKNSHSNVTIYHGCRKEQDFIYKKKIYALKHHFKIHLAVSQEGEKIHIQELIKRDVDDLIAKLFNEGRIYICGGVPMCKEIVAIIRKRLQELKPDDYSTIWGHWVEKKQIQQEMWQ
jgi:sulfite reductase alpha subunit-like flavoprotein